ncbi:ABC transporter substrate-binding protein [Phytoactinopolyspora halotolerans]|uniref:ABC transporter substrate-binding protein n=1 Tax=Phytoactinopolyspora halotolerans TaxID=1981512 RepID=A0A6L9SGZ5_9ACTN|nr:ABC transporter substrate-binding protein [Phytoactinopolyspora halotolerans]NEE03601.1 ABC transporter substrate-binding protein [Phytoactinopolyspora halotolerans]
MKIRTVRASLAAAAGFALMAGIAACGGSGDGSDDASAETTGNTTAEPSGAPADDAGPVTIEHRYGSTEVDEPPERVVSVDLPWNDVMLAMGVEPVGYAIDAYMPEPGVPWQELPDDAVAIDGTDGLPFEQIAALEPDLIVGTFTIDDEQTYERLSDIAPTIASPDEHQVTPWQELVRVAGEVLDRQESAQEIIASVDGQVAAVADELPGLQGRTFALAQYVVGDSMYIVADEEDGSSVFFQQLGMEMFAPVVEHGRETGDSRINVSAERADLLEADLLAFLVNGGDESDLADIPGFDQLPGTVAVLDYATVVGLNTPSPLSIPYALEQLRPYLEQAAA